ncbi:expressed unknown protein [Seminavis robusta]|uniref:Peptidase C1A papain C-terminal domain-containing protein n=1 Tax=Seminavis robusta TaxID=568900 RepID=A0A9N8H2L6_9STRA|nr:expressed unknown protein [Seminavis robusta]|eukprot:Sro68_g037950.1 n/a (384) ;mRNA; f:20996-22147
MEGRFGRIILQQVDRVLLEEPSRDALLSLLKIADPALESEELPDERKRKSAFRQLQLLIHPDKHNGDGQATKRFQDAKSFFDMCITVLHKRRCTQIPTPSVNLPSEFHVCEEWPFLANGALGPIRNPTVPPNTALDERTLELTIAFNCINCRGAIAHGKRTELFYNDEDVTEASVQTAKDLFEEDFDSAVDLESIDEIKEAIMERGPVVSTSFRLTQSFLNAGDHAHEFEAGLVNSNHAILIVGWKQTAFGEMWLVRSYKGSQDIPIAMGQFSLEEEVLEPDAPMSIFPWQDEEKCFDHDNLPDIWYSQSAIWMPCKEDQLQNLFKALGCSVHTALRKKIEFVIREEDVPARSRYAYLTDLEWVQEEKEWLAHATFCDEFWTK